MSCRVCGDENAKYYSECRQSLCPACKETTPDKVSRSVFESLYWGEELNTIHWSTRRDFYDDYLASTHTVDEYIKATTGNTEG